MKNPQFLTRLKPCVSLLLNNEKMILETLLEIELINTFLSLGLLLLFAFVFGKIFEYFKAPKVIGEIVGGMILGGSCLYYFFPQLITSIFNAYDGQGKTLNIFYQLGLIFLMVSSGYNTTLEFDKNNKKSIFLLFFGATIIPIVAGIPFIQIFQKNFIGVKGNDLSFGLVFLIGVAITSIPVISKIFFDMNIMNSKFANLVLTTSTFQDLCLWILLNIATQVATTQEVNIWKMILVSISTIAIFVVILLLSNYIKKKNVSLKDKNFFAFMYIFLFFTLALLTKIGINLMYSSFLVGFVIKALTQNNKNIETKFNTFTEITLTFFVPIYFALVGIQLDVIHNFSLFRFLLFFIIAFSLEGLGVIIALLFSNFNKDTILNLAVTMNARGGPGIVLATTAYSYGIINLEFFTVIILTTMVSSTLAGCWLRYQNKKPNMYSKLYKNDN